MAIILEGPDNSGKSTLAAVIQEKIGWDIVHAGDACTPEDVQQRLLNDISTMQTNVIMDRSCIISETVYSAALGRPQLFDGRSWFRKLQFLDSVGDTLIIFCLPPVDAIENKPRIHRIDENPAHVNEAHRNLARIHDQYVRLSNAVRIFVDATVTNPFDQTPQILEMVDWFAKRST